MIGRLAARVLEGARSNAVALTGAFLLLAIIWLLPDLMPAPPPGAEIPPVYLAHGRIIDIIPGATLAGEPDVRVLVLEGEHKGETMLGRLQGPSGQEELPTYRVGEEVVVSISEEPDSQFVAVSDRYRVPMLGLIFGIFAVAVTVVGGWRGLRSILALVFTLAVMIKVVIPLILQGIDPVPLAIVTATGVTLVTFVLTEGMRRSTLAALIGTFAAVALTAVLAAAFTELAQFTKIQGSEDLVYLQTFVPSGFDLGGLLLAAVIFGALGVLDDVTVTQAATVEALHAADPTVSRPELFGRAMHVGRSHIAATVNTLVLAYVGASLPLLVLFAVGRQSPLLIASGEAVAVEVVRAMIGSIGIVAAVPLTTAVGVMLVGMGGGSVEQRAIRRRSGGG